MGENAQERARESGHFGIYMVHTPYNGRTRVWEKLGKQFSGRHKFDFGPRAVLRGFHARGIFLGKSLSKVADSFEPYPTNIPFIRDTCGTCTSSGW